MNHDNGYLCAELKYECGKNIQSDIIINTTINSLKNNMVIMVKCDEYDIYLL